MKQDDVIPPDVVSEFYTVARVATTDRMAAAIPVLRGATAHHRDEHVDAPILYSVAQAARRLNCSRSTVWRIMRARGIKKVELYPGCERIRRSDIDSLAGGAA